MAKRLFNIGRWMVMWTRVWSVNAFEDDLVDQWTIRVNKPRWRWYTSSRFEKLQLLIEWREFGWLSFRRYTEMGDEE